MIPETQQQKIFPSPTETHNYLVPHQKQCCHYCIIILFSCDVSHVTRLSKHPQLSGCLYIHTLQSLFQNKRCSLFFFTFLFSSYDSDFKPFVN